MHQIKSLYTSKETITTCSTDGGLISKICKELKKLNSKRTNGPINKWANKLNRQFSEEIQMTNKYMKKCSTFLVKKKKAKQNYTKIPSHPSWIGHHQENKQ
jgi:hypothetical protein